MTAGHIRQRSPGSWEIKIEIGRDPKTGKRRTKFKTVKGTKREAQRERRKILTAIDQGTYADAGKTTVAEFLRGWIAGRRHSVAPLTIERYEQLAEKHIIPEIGGLLLAQLTTARLDRLYVDKQENGRLDGKGGLSPQTVLHIDRLLHTAFEAACRKGLLFRNPTQHAERPKVEKRAKRVLDDDEFRALLDRAEGGRLYAPLYTILSTGLRRGEVLALRWRNIAIDDRALFVVESLEETKHGLRVKEVKTAASRRQVDLPASAVDVLRQHRLEQRKEHFRLGLGWSVDTLVFPTPLGEPQRPRDFTKSVTRLAKAAGIDGFTPHAGRHDHFTRLLRAGTHPKIAQVRAGHSSIQVTLDVYSHAAPTLQREAAERIDNAFRKIRKAAGGNRVAIGCNHHFPGEGRSDN